MAVRPRSLLLAASLGASSFLVALVAATPAQAQDVTTTTIIAFGGEVTEPAAGSSTAVPVDGASTTVADGSPETTQEVTQGSSSESSLFTESRKVLAAVGGLVVCALALTLLTIRYVRATRPVPRDADGAAKPLRSSGPVNGTEAAIAAAAAAEPSPVRASAPDAAPGAGPAAAVEPSSAADHVRADADYEPQGTGEHARVELPVAATNRPGAAARAAALGRSGSL